MVLVLAMTNASAADWPSAFIPPPSMPGMPCPHTVTLAKDDSLYFADYGNVYKLDVEGQLSVVANATDDGNKFRNLSDLAFDAKGNLFIVDSSNNAICKISADGKVTTLVGRAEKKASIDGKSDVAALNKPTSLAVDAAGNLFVTDTDGNCIRKITPDGTVSTYSGQAGVDGSVDGAASEVRWGKPCAVRVDRTGNLFVLDEEYNTIRKIASDRSVSTLAGNPAQGRGSKNGIKSEATFSLPQGLAVDVNGNVYVADTGNNMIRKITPAGVVTNLGRTPQPGGQF